MAAPHSLWNAIPQLIPADVCRSCDVCCHFPDADGRLAPVVTEAERSVLEDSRFPVRDLPSSEIGGTDPDIRKSQIEKRESPLRGHFRPVGVSAGAKIEPVPASGAGFLCPFYVPATGECGVHAQRPIDCRLYPFTLTESPRGTEVVLGIDWTCPAIGRGGYGDRFRAAAEELARTLEEEGTRELIAGHHALVGRYYPEVEPLVRLPGLTRSLARRGRGGDLDPFPAAGPPLPAGLDLVRARPGDDALLESLERHAGEGGGAGAAQAALPALFPYAGVMALGWTELDGALVIVAANGEAAFLPRPPVGPDPVAAARQALEALDAGGASPGAARIEGLSDRGAELFREAGWRVTPRRPEYVYRRRDLVELQGPALRGPRRAVRVASRRLDPSVRRYRPEDRAAAWELFERWHADRLERTVDPARRGLLRHAAAAHWRILEDPGAMGLEGYCLFAKAELSAYTFAFGLDAGTLCVLAEIARPGTRGAGPLIFHALCARKDAFEYVNTLDDAASSSLAWSKDRYGPARLDPVFVAHRSREENHG